MASTRLTRTTFGSQTSQRKFTISVWCKICDAPNDESILFHAYSSGTETMSFSLENARNLKWTSASGGNTYNVKTNAKYRDPNGWYHFVAKVDTTQATAADRVKLYVNGEEITSLATSTYPAQNADIPVPNSTYDVSIGSWYAGSGSQFWNGSMAHFHFTDGYSYAASTFGETDSTSGIWKPKTGPSVTYGNNGFFLKFQDSSSLGDDSSGNTNDFTLSGSGKQILDTPSNVFATWNPLSRSTGNTYSNGNTTVSYANNYQKNANATLIFNSGKWYAEFKRAGTANFHIGIVGNTFLEDGRIVTDTSANHTYNMRGHTGCVTLISNTADQSIFVDGSDSSTDVDFFTSAGDIVMVAFDVATKKIWFGKNGTWSGSGDPANGTNPSYTYSGTATSDFTFGTDTENGSTCYANFGNGYFGTTAISSAENDDAGYGKFEYDVPAGFYALCTKNINTYG
jgi:hypothetical protein